MSKQIANRNFLVEFDSVTIANRNSSKRNSVKSQLINRDYLGSWTKVGYLRKGLPSENNDMENHFGSQLFDKSMVTKDENVNWFRNDVPGTTVDHVIVK
ncbi:hypothetical protein P8452_39611 [Trifolium repens]|nr:hypothetical protein P8452_39611 [Trifolium repens]